MPDKNDKYVHKHAQVQITTKFKLLQLLFQYSRVKEDQVNVAKGQVQVEVGVKQLLVYALKVQVLLSISIY